MAHDREPASWSPLDFDDVTMDGRAWMVRPRFAETHLESAAFEARRAYALEQKLPAGPKYEEQYYPDLQGDDGYIEHRACVTGALFCAVAAIEGALSALYVDAVAKNPSSRTPVERDLAAEWDGVCGKPIPVKVTAALRAVNARPKHLTSWPNTENLLRLRNLLTHFTGGSTGVHADLAAAEDGSVQPNPAAPAESPHLTNLEGLLHGTGFALNPLDADRVFPFAYLGYGCAAWAVESSRAFIDELYDRLGERSPFADTEAYARRRNLPSPFTTRPLPPTVDPAG